MKIAGINSQMRSAGGRARPIGVFDGSGQATCHADGFVSTDTEDGDA